MMGAVMRRSRRRKRSRIGGIRSAIGSEPAALMAKEITTPGDRQIKAMFVSAGNPVLSVPNGDELEAAFETLELSVALDFYVTETTARCDYILPVTTMYERDDFPYTFQAFQATPFRQATEAVVAPAGEARPEWDIVDDLARRLGRQVPAFAAFGVARKALSVFGTALTPRIMIDALIRMSQGGDRFGLRRGGLTLRRLTEQHPHGVVVAPHIQTGVLRDAVAYLSRRDPVGPSRYRRRGRQALAQRPSRGLPAADDRHAGATLGELVDAQLAVVDARRAVATMR